MSRGDRGGYRSTRITTGTTTAVKAATGILRSILIEAALTGTVTVNDSVGARLILPVAFPAGNYRVDLAMGGKIEIVTSAADRVVAIYD